MKLDIDKNKKEETRNRMEKRAEGATPTATTPVPQMGWNRQVSDLQTILANIESLFYVDITDGKTTRRVPLVEVLRKGLEEIKTEGPAVRDGAEELRREVARLRSDLLSVQKEYNDLGGSIRAIKVPKSMEPSDQLLQVKSELNKVQEGIVKATEEMTEERAKTEEMLERKLPQLTEGARKYIITRDYAPWIFSFIIAIMGGLVIWRAVEVAKEGEKVDQRAKEVEQWAKSVRVEQNRGLFADWLIDEWAPKNPKTWQNINRKWEEKVKEE